MGLLNLGFDGVLAGYFWCSLGALPTGYALVSSGSLWLALSGLVPWFIGALFMVGWLQ